MKKLWERIVNGVIRENPTFVLMLGMCATLAVTSTAVNGLGMGLSTAAVLVLSNSMISLLRRVIPSGVRMPAYIVIIASFVTMVQLLLQAYVPSLYRSLGIFIPLIVVNCIILGRAEAYASKNPVLPSAFDGLGMGLGFTLSLTVIGAVRELFGSGTLFGVQIMPSFYQPIAILVMAPGAFFVLALLAALQNKLKAGAKGGKGSTGCGSCAGCAGCPGSQSCPASPDEGTPGIAGMSATPDRKKLAADAAQTVRREEGGTQP